MRELPNKLLECCLDPDCSKLQGIRTANHFREEAQWASSDEERNELISLSKRFADQAARKRCKNGEETQ